MGMGVWLDGRWKRIRGIGLALLHREEGAAGLSAAHLDSPLVGRVTAVSGQGSGGLLRGVVIVEQLVL